MRVRCFQFNPVGMVCLLAIASVVLAAAGCGPPEPFTHVHITGKITYEDGTPIPAHKVSVIFNPQAAPIDPKTHPRAGVTDLEADGSFANVTSHKYGDGVVVGKHKVQVIPYDDQERELKVIPKEYLRSGTTPLEIDTADFSDDKPYDIKIPKP